MLAGSMGQTHLPPRQPIPPTNAPTHPHVAQCKTTLSRRSNFGCKCMLISAVLVPRVGQLGTNISVPKKTTTSAGIGFRLSQPRQERGALLLIQILACSELRMHRPENFGVRMMDCPARERCGTVHSNCELLDLIAKTLLRLWRAGGVTAGQPFF